MADPSHRRKLARAELHLKDVETMLTRWSGDGYRVFDQSDGKGHFVLYAEQLKPLPDQLALAIGDALHCQRSSLDQLIFALSRKYTTGMTAKDEEEPAFPIYDGAVRLANKRIKFLDPRAQQDVRALAPDPARQPLDEDPLWLLNKTENRDKHREIPVAVVVSAVQEYALTASDGTDYMRIIGPQRPEVGAGPVALAEFARSPGVQAQISHATRVVFDQGVEVADREVIPTLRWFHNHIQDTVFERLEKHL